MLPQLQALFCLCCPSLSRRQLLAKPSQLGSLGQRGVSACLAVLELLPQILDGLSLRIQLAPLPGQLFRLHSKLPRPLLGLGSLRAGTLQPGSELLLLLSHPGTLRVGPRSLIPRRGQRRSRLFLRTDDSLLLRRQGDLVGCQPSLSLFQARLGCSKLLRTAAQADD